ncbi:ABC transporter permease [Kinneretia asaccharophila]|jgi:oligopeptide transport system permease protein|uniref:Peptide/nickel transport system permease protein n=1 Tax=Roseateles asaccharophilus TaxID=582607 RepID=A0A4R6NBJ7_9BURK|nr:ABC transporter permease [Roseateles asaccharophilus]MDN3543133.1 ABC transporter permease [Roseateles asaccharophilus]TDP13169.1 peptide/nickel transport system permease protein [Roseateles asaccharophilus]
MSAVLSTPNTAAAKPQRSEGVWAASWRRMRADKVGMVCMTIVGLFLLLVIASGAGLVAKDWQKEVGVANAPPTFMGPAPAEAMGTIATPKGPNVDLSDIDPLAPRYQEWEERAKQFKTEEVVKAETLPLGGDRLGRDVLAKVIKGAEVSIMVGVLAAVVATIIGTVLGAISGFFGGKVGDFLEWLYNVFTAIPGILLIFAFAVIFGRGVLSVVMILGLAGWPGIYRLIRAEFMKHSVREYVRSAEAIGASKTSRMFKHILPNVSHVALVQLSLHVVAFIKSEVILSYLGLGVGVDQVSWGTMLSESQSELILGYWWQLAAVTGFMAIFVTAFALFTDALRDALDPKLRGLE